jgi:quinohemoprotein ethanol dehydrogenase
MDTADPAFHMAGVYVQLLIREPEDGKGALLAWDPIKQEPRWKVQHPSYWNGGPLATAGGLVFQGTADGPLIAYDSLTGAERWRFDAKLGIIATPISYTVGGKQHISVLVGPGGSIAPVSHLSNRGFKYGAQPRRLLTFALDGKATLPPTAPRDFVVRAVDDPALTIDPAQAQLGGRLFQDNCTYCHGRLLVSPGSPAPDLRESHLAVSWEAFRATVREGRLPKLMPRFPELSDDQMRAIYMYIRSGAREALARQRTHQSDAGSLPR